MSFPFTQPSNNAGGFFKPAEHDGHLVLITQVHKIEDRYDQFKKHEVPAATCDLVDLDDSAQELREGVLITHTGIVNRLSPGAHMVLGRIGKALTKNGFEAWVLGEFDPAADPARAQAWLDSQSGVAPAAQSQQQTPAPQAAPVPAPQQQAPAAQGMADPNDPAVQALLQSLQK
ncbi:hypothetical protein [Nocardiopsis salina]|uniref:hypothetical protein n=1 Tax=Nocardiopsis salina TaxID=245836 RepID=UPI0003496C98|nr:hypothetical protein [Nocardiopsis salina]